MELLNKSLFVEVVGYYVKKKHQKSAIDFHLAFNASFSFIMS